MIRTQSNITLGAFLSHCPAVSDNFYGTGESWLFSFREETVRIFAWTGENNFILQGNTESLVVGAGKATLTRSLTSAGLILQTAMGSDCGLTSH